MKLSIEKGNQSIDFVLQPFTQLCGENIMLKKYVVDSLCKHFSSSKYQEHEEQMINNVRINGVDVGRRYFDCAVVRTRNDLIKAVALAKTGIVYEQVVHMLQKHDYQSQLLEIERSLCTIFDGINEELCGAQIPIRVDYESAALFDIIQKSNTVSIDGRSIEFLTNYGLIEAFVKLICERQCIKGSKVLLIFENIDHLLSRNEYEKLSKLIELAIKKTDLWIVTTSSLQGYVFSSKEYFRGINCFNELVYSFPQYEELKTFVLDNYPICCEFSDEELLLVFAESSALVGCSCGKPEKGKARVVAKLINETLCFSSNNDWNLSDPEMAFLRHKKAKN